MRKLSIVLILAFTAATVYGQSCDQPIGIWQNDRTSQLVIDSISKQGKLYGKYLSYDGTEGQTFDVAGWYADTSATDKRAISFSVYWKPYHTITSWTGYCNIKTNQLHTLWHYYNPESRWEFQEWSTGQSIFTPQNPSPK